MKFSVITVTYNAESYLEQTLLSVARQNFTDYEHIVWDGGSTDQTLAIVGRYPHIKLHQGHDSGIADAMNKGAAVAKGEFIVHLHADDLFAHPQVLSMVALYLQQHPQVQWLYGRSETIDSQGGVIKTPPLERYSYSRLRKYNFITHPSTYVMRTLFDQVGGFNQSLCYCMDYDLWLRLASHAPAFSLSVVLSFFREHAYSLSTSEPIGVADEAYRVRSEYMRTWVEKYRSYRTWKKRRR